MYRLAGIETKSNAQPKGNLKQNLKKAFLSESITPQNHRKTTQFGVRVIAYALLSPTNYAKAIMFYSSNEWKNDGDFQYLFPCWGFFVPGGNSLLLN